MYRIQIRQTDRPKPWYWRVVAKNGQVLLTSETYASKRNAERAAYKYWLEVNTIRTSHFMDFTP